jgi:hypothetical protein
VHAGGGGPENGEERGDETEAEGAPPHLSDRFHLAADHLPAGPTASTIDSTCRSMVFGSATSP